MKKYLIGLVFIFSLSQLWSQQNDSIPIPEPVIDTTSKTFKVYTFDIKEEIAPPVWRTTQKAFEAAYEAKADLMLIHMNTYGGMVDAADSIRTKILNSRIPVYVFIDNNAASAGALISIACDSIYMISGANIGAATVVNQSGEVVPDKYQSYMRSMMRSTAEAKGRDPMIAQAMVDPSIYVAGISDSGKVLTFTTSEAIEFGFAEGQVSSLEEVLQHAGHEDYELIKHTLSPMDKVINFLIHPAISGILIMIIIGGLYFEIQTPGIGFPLAASVVAALMYFAPLYLEGLATNWEVLVFVLGVILLLVEIFAIPGFGVAGVVGLSLIIAGLSFSMVETIGDTPFSVDYMALAKSFFVVIIAVFSSMIISLYLSQKLFSTNRFGHLALDTVQNKSDGFTSADRAYSTMIGKKGTSFTMLRPSGKVYINDEMFDATAVSGYIDADTEVEVLSYQTGQLFVRKV
ncbi:MAG: nodulation protein NfeD [Bacteroidetes bacterium]|jgi:membrane-bound serine protease (ClpP class)|nr:nodulation protein NfeD [Bacteroidota bacterium]